MEYRLKMQTSSRHLVINKVPLNAICTMRNRAISEGLETGGLLIGYYKGPVAVVTEATRPPKDSARTRATFTRGVLGVERLMLSRWGAQRRTFYIGEWHCHFEDDPKPTSLDVETMLEISLVDGREGVPEPILVLAGYSNIRAFLFDRGKGPEEFHV